MSDYMYILIFIFAGCAWAGLALLVAAFWIGFMRLTKPEPKPTVWEQEWQQIERNLSK
jgi:hypothetical protein